LKTTELSMPGLGGAETLPRLRAIAPALHIIIATGRVDRKAVDLVENFRGVTLLPKPCWIKELRACLGVNAPP
jgi:CheY-like chemotaxis protein